MLQTHTEFDQAESERLTQAQAEIDRLTRQNAMLVRWLIKSRKQRGKLSEQNEALTQALKDIHLVAHRYEWHSFTVDTPEGYVYRRSKEIIEGS